MSFNFIVAVILEPKKLKSVTVSIISPSICYEVRGILTYSAFRLHIEWGVLNAGYHDLSFLTVEF